MKDPKATRGMTQLWVIGKLKYSTLIVNQYPSYTVKLCLSNDNRATLRMMWKKCEILGKNCDLSLIETVINMLTRPNKVQELIDLITNNKEVHNIVQAKDI